MAEDMGEKTEEPTERARKEAKEKGQVAKSMDLSSAILMAGAIGLMIVFGSGLMTRMAMLIYDMLGRSATGNIEHMQGALLNDVARWGVIIGGMLLPIMALMVIVAYLSGVVQVGPMFSARTLEPNLKKFNIIKGLGQMFARKKLVKGGLDILKLLVLAAACWIVGMRRWDEVLTLAVMDLGQAIQVIGVILAELIVWCLVLLIVLGIADFQFQKWQTTQDLKMTKQQVKDERKSTDGDMETKGRRMKMAREMMVQRLGQDVPQADVIVTNPTHYSVALKYDQHQADAPKVVAKGADYVALKIRSIAKMHGVPIVERPPLARALYANCAVGEEVHPDQYEAVAEVLAYVYRLEGRAAAAV